VSDRELLELAAKAAGIILTPVEIKNVTKQGDDRFAGYRTAPDQWPRGWFDPLTDDGDALRLAVKLRINLELQYRGMVYATTEEFDVDAPHGTDPLAATRRAITHAAAEIGRNMK
jgi:hypothetical protein